MFLSAFCIVNMWDVGKKHKNDGNTGKQCFKNEKKNIMNGLKFLTDCFSYRSLCTYIAKVR